jgi:hypothetical protein
MAGFGARFRAVSNAAVNAAATPPSGNAAEAIWHQLYDTQYFTQAAPPGSLTFFIAPSVDRTLSNMPQGGVLPRPQSLQIYQITLDILPDTSIATGATQNYVTTAAAGAVTGILDDMALLVFGGDGRPIWTLEISDKKYGPYSVTVLHGTGGPTGWGWTDGGGAGADLQFAKQSETPGWTYEGRVIIPEQVNFQFTIVWNVAPAALTNSYWHRVSLFGVLNRRVL